MKSLKLLLVFIIILMTSLPSVLLGQKKLPNLPDENWRKAEFNGMLNGIKAYDLYYYRALKPLDGENKSVIINVILVYTPYGLKHRDELDINSSTVAKEYSIGVDNQDRCFVYKYTSYGKDGENYSHQNDTWGLIYPDPGTIEEHYIYLAKKLAKEK